MGNAVAQVGNFANRRRNTFPAPVLREVWKGIAKLFAPELRIIARLKHPHPEAKREASDYLTNTFREFSIADTSPDRLYVGLAVVIREQLKRLALPPFRPKLANESAVHRVAQGDLNRLDGDMERFSQLSVPNVEPHCPGFVMAGGNQIGADAFLR